MKYQYSIVDGLLEWEGLSIGNLLTGEKLTFDELRQIVIVSTRFAAGRRLKDRTLEEWHDDLKVYIIDRQRRKAEADQEVAELRATLSMMESRMAMLNAENNELRLAYNAVTGDL